MRNSVRILRNMLQLKEGAQTTQDLFPVLQELNKAPRYICMCTVPKLTENIDGAYCDKCKKEL